MILLLGAGIPLPDAGIPPPDTGIPLPDAGIPLLDEEIPPLDGEIPPLDAGIPPLDAGIPPPDAWIPPLDTENPQPTLEVGIPLRGESDPQIGIETIRHMIKDQVDLTVVESIPQVAGDATTLGQPVKAEMCPHIGGIPHAGKEGIPRQTGNRGTQEIKSKNHPLEVEIIHQVNLLT